MINNENYKISNNQLKNSELMHKLHCKESKANFFNLHMTKYRRQLTLLQRQMGILTFSIQVNLKLD